MPDHPTGPTVCRGLRGATVADSGTLAEATLELVTTLLDRHGCARNDVSAVIFTLTDDLEGLNPAAALRAAGWDRVPLMMTRDHDSTTLRGCIRVLLLVNTTLGNEELRHAYLRGSDVLRPDLSDALSAIPAVMS